MPSFLALSFFFSRKKKKMSDSREKKTIGNPLKKREKKGKTSKNVENIYDFFRGRKFSASTNFIYVLSDFSCDILLFYVSPSVRCPK